MSDELTGGCACGDIRYTVSGAPLYICLLYTSPSPRDA